MGDKPNREKIAGRSRWIGRDTVQTAPDSGLKKRRATDERARGVSDSRRGVHASGKERRGALSWSSRPVVGPIGLGCEEENGLRPKRERGGKEELG